MLGKKNIRVLVLDDSVFFCQMISMHLEKEEGIEVVGVATDAGTAFKMVEQLKPDVLTVDIEMPVMDGIEFTRRIVPVFPVPIIILSAIDSRVFEAMSAGAVDFVLKPDPDNMGVTGFMTELLVKIRAAMISKVRPDSFGEKAKNQRGMCKLPDHKENLIMESVGVDTEKVIAIGASTGGTEAIMQILKGLPKNFPPVLISQHIPKAFSKMFAERADAQCAIQVKEAENGEEIRAGIAYVAPGDAQMCVEKIMSKYYIKCEYGVMHNGYAPCIDLLFESVSKCYKEKAIGVILTGMGKDGAQGLLSMKESGAFTIGQDEETSVIYGMPLAAKKIGAVQKQLSVFDIPAVLLNKLKK